MRDNCLRTNDSREHPETEREKEKEFQKRREEKKKTKRRTIDKVVRSESDEANDRVSEPVGW